MNHEMKLNPIPFGQMRNGEKTVELRLNDDKRRAIRVGDTITFAGIGTGETLTATVKALHRFDSFPELFATLGTDCCGGSVDMDAYYAPEQQKKWGVLGIEVAKC